MSSINVFASMPLILSIPMELLIKIFGELELRDLLRSQEVNIPHRFVPDLFIAHFHHNIGVHSIPRHHQRLHRTAVSD